MKKYLQNTSQNDDIWFIFKLKNAPNTRYIWEVPQAQQPVNVQQLSVGIMRECQSVPCVLTQNAFDGMVDRCFGYQNADRHSFH